MQVRWRVVHGSVLGLATSCLPACLPACPALPACLLALRCLPASAPQCTAYTPLHCQALDGRIHPTTHPCSGPWPLQRASHCADQQGRALAAAAQLTAAATDESDDGDSGAATSVAVSWVPAVQGPEQAACVSYEVEASAGKDAPVRHAFPARAQGGTLSGLRPGRTYSVRVRAAGADSAGHGEWSEAASVKLPPAKPSTAAAAAAAAAAQETAASKPHKRRGGGGGQTAPRVAAVTKTTTARGPPKRGFAAVDAWFKRKAGFSIPTLAVTVVVVAVLALLALFFTSSFVVALALALAVCGLSFCATRGQPKKTS